MKPVIIDTDIASGIGGDVDDALALILALASEELDIKGITIAYGNVDLKAKLALNILALMKRKVPVARGASLSLSFDLKRRGPQEGFGEIKEVELLDKSLKPEKVHAVDFIIEKAREIGSLSLITIGPLTNIALALLKEPELVDHIEHAYIMGGVFNNFLDNKVMPIMEYNVSSDPLAAHVVLSSGIKYTLVPLDVTMRVPLTRNEINMLKNSSSRIAKFIVELTRPRPVWYLHDPLTVGVAIDETFVETVYARVEVVTQGKWSGRTFATRGEPKGRICVDVRSEQFIRFFMNRLMGMRND